MLMRFDPFREIDRMTRRSWPQAPAGLGWTPTLGAIDAYRSEHQVVVLFDLPGVDADSIEITVEQDVLQVSAQRAPFEREGDQVLVAERPNGSFSRQLFLGQGLDLEHIEASYDRGVLTVTIPVAEGARPRRIAIETPDQGTQSIKASAS